MSFPRLKFRLFAIRSFRIATGYAFGLQNKVDSSQGSLDPVLGFAFFAGKDEGASVIKGDVYLKE